MSRHTIKASGFRLLLENFRLPFIAKTRRGHIRPFYNIAMLILRFSILIPPDF